MNLSVIEKLQPTPGHVVMMCGVAGSGKTAFAKALEAKGFVRISIDEYIWQHFGRFGIDYAQTRYVSLQDIAEKANLEKLETLVQKRVPCVLDYSFWSRAQRLRYRRLVEGIGGRVTLVCLHADSEVLRRRLQVRNKERHANAAFEISQTTLARYVDGFEMPDDDENAVMVTQVQER